MSWDFGTYSGEIVQEFYVLYTATLRESLDRRAWPTKYYPFTYTLYQGCRVDISNSTIPLLYCSNTGPKVIRNIVVFYYRLQVV